MGSNATTKITEDIVGWTVGPETRGTLSLVWSCVMTIFACTWTVLHLNVPGRGENWRTTAPRKFKWMIINVLFPEFILAKAVCDLRLALYDIQEIEKSLQLRNKASHHDACYFRGKTLKHEWIWVVEYPFDWLYRLLFVPLPKDLRAEDTSSNSSRISSERDQTQSEPSGSLDSEGGTQAGSPANEKTEPGPSTSAKPKKQEIICWRTVRKWTIVHTYYAQMGGLLHPSKPCPDSLVPMQSLTEDPQKSLEPHYNCLTASKLTSRYKWDQNQPPPLNEFLLGKKEINDKSKADWFLKTIAVFQIAWIILGVITRSVVGLPITQLEIATISFAVMAIITYMANLWKPKDVSHATVLPTFRGGTSNKIQSGDRTQSFLLWLQSPKKAAKEAKEIKDTHRVKNDMVWIEGDVPFIVIVMAISSLLFGGLHCLAWNFEFPSATERLCWKIASLTASILPVITLAICSSLAYVSTRYFEIQLISAFLGKLNPSRGPESSWLKDLSNDIENKTPDVVMTFMRKSIYTGDGHNFVSRTQSKTQITSEPDKLTIGKYWDLYHRLQDFQSQWEKAKAIVSDQDRTKASAMKLRKSWFNTASELENIADMFPKVLTFWNEYEESVNGKSSGPNTPSLSNFIRGIIQAQEQVKHDKLDWGSFKFRKASRQLSTTITACSSIVYAAARLITLVLLFTSLRQTPVDVYQITPWVQFLPSIS